MLFNPNPTTPQFRTRTTRTCAVCGRPLWQANAKKRFCGDRCRQAAHRSQKWADQYETSRSGRHHPSRVSRSVENSPSTSRVCKAILAGRAFSIIGPKHVIEIEVFADRAINSDGSRYEIPAEAAEGIDPVIKARADGLIAQIPADLSIPDFLRRR
jgi:endogenous inhibitor of DNA gyrase (YacG/DUF329 family)